VAEYEETLKLIIKTQDETTSVVNKITVEMEKLQDRQRKVVNESEKASTALGKIGDAFGMIIKRSPYVLAADFVTRILGVRNLMTGLNTVMDNAAASVQAFGKAALGITPDMERSTELVKKYREEYELLVAKINQERGIRALSFGQTAIVPPNIQGLPEAIKLLADYSKAIEDPMKNLASLERFAGEGGDLNRVNQVNKFVFAERSRLATELNQKLRELSDAQQQASDTLKTMREEQERSAKASQAQLAAMEKMSRSWSQTYTGAGTSQPGGSTLLPEVVKAASSYAEMALSAALAGNESRKHAAAVAEMQERAQETLKTLRFSNQVQGTWKKTVEGMEAVWDRMLAKIQQAPQAVESGGLGAAFKRMNEGLEIQQQMWDNIAATIQYNVGSAIGQILTNIEDAEDVMRNLLRALQQGINMALGQAASSWLFGPTPNAKGNIFSGGNVVPFARGGVVGGPTVFPMSGGRTGLMGEAGPEAVVPLRRGPDGNLGIASAGGTSVSLTLNVGSLDPRGAADVIMSNLRAIEDGLADAIAKGSHRGLRASIAGVR